jgi:hypothetical protein
MSWICYMPVFSHSSDHVITFRLMGERSLNIAGRRARPTVLIPGGLHLQGATSSEAEREKAESYCGPTRPCDANSGFLRSSDHVITFQPVG